MWLFFPYSAYVAKRLSINQLCDRIVYCYYIQLATLYVVFIITLILIGDYSSAFSLSTMNPWTRFQFVSLISNVAKISFHFKPKISYIFDR